MKISKIKFLKSSAKVTECPATTLKEFAFIVGQMWVNLV